MPLLLVIGFGESDWNYGYGKVSYGRKAFNYLTSGKCSKSKSLISYVSLLLLLNSYAYHYCRCRSDHRHRSRQVPLMFELISDLAFSRASFSKSDLYGTNSLEGIQTYSICHFRNRTRLLNLRHCGYVPSNHRGSVLCQPTGLLEPRQGNRTSTYPFSDLGGAQPLHFFFTPTHLLLGMTLLPCPWESL